MRIDGGVIDYTYMLSCSLYPGHQPHVVVGWTSSWLDCPSLDGLLATNLATLQVTSFLALPWQSCTFLKASATNVHMHMYMYMYMYTLGPSSSVFTCTCTCIEVQGTCIHTWIQCTCTCKAVGGIIKSSCQCSVQWLLSLTEMWM